MKDYGLANFETIATRTLKDAGEPVVIIGPCVCQPSDGAAARRWYFCLVTCDLDKQFRIDTASVPGEGREETEAARTSFMQILAARDVAVHDAEDELTMARLCERLWPGEDATKMRQEVEAELMARASHDVDKEGGANG
jgi:hypothetical protein